MVVRMCGFVVVVCMMVLVSVVSSTAPDTTPTWNPAWGPQPVNTMDFTTLLWYGFSNDKAKLTADDFEDLVECVTGRKVCPAIDSHPALSFLTDCQANTALTPRQCALFNTCGKSEVLGTYTDDAVDESPHKTNLSINELREILPAMLYLSQQDHSCQNTSQPPQQQHSNKPLPSEVWGYGILFVTLISGCSLAGVSVLPLMAHQLYQQLLTLLVGLAVGSLAASSVFHLLPQAFNLAELYPGGHHKYLFVSLYVLMGVWGFFMVERLIKIIVTHHAAKEERQQRLQVSASEQAILCETGLHSPDPSVEGAPGVNNGTGPGVGGGGGGGGGYKVTPPLPQTTQQQQQQQQHPPPPTSPHHHPNQHIRNHHPRPTDNMSCVNRDVTQIYESQQQAIKASFGHSERPEPEDPHHHMLEFRQGEDSVIRTVAWMIIFGDGFHNFIDGVSIGAAFSESILTGISISLAVMCEELPHELGDFAVLLNAGMTMKQAVAYNFLSATTCYVGLFLGIALGEFTHDTTAVFAVAAGMFLYIALVDMVPEMNEVGSKAAEGGWRSALKVLLLQNIGISIGIASLFCLAYFQDHMILV
ncbi:hypothetical protein Pcinc_035761 [Petrolisthes cinctipes]|uniref:Zinc transporter ZIP14 n=1 Tax=Petrolisthes cinctipes TaxID=88211 RepID=A0AAE1BWB5_PETCI|nr:hypothetical protein Pcinc_035761 [Petrolisthes cinctipes]